jgi:adenylate kinase
MSDVIKIDALEFVKLIEAKEISKRLDVMASLMAEKLHDKNPIFLIVLNGAFIFGADLLRRFEFDCDIIFVDAKSYEGTASTGEVKIETQKLDEVKGRHVVIIEDIVDSGRTIEAIRNECEHLNAASIQVASFLTKPSVHNDSILIDFVGFEIAPMFVIGYGLDYNGKGRNLKDIYQIRPFVK